MQQSADEDAARQGRLWRSNVYVCICNCVTDHEIRACADLGCCTLDELRNHIGVASCCGRCAPTAEQVLRDHASERVGCEAALGG